jgi:hypothetical protein
VPYLNVTVVAALLALTVPLSVAADTVTPLAAPVVTVGAETAAIVVLPVLAR